MQPTVHARLVRYCVQPGDRQRYARAGCLRCAVECCCSSLCSHARRCASRVYAGWKADCLFSLAGSTGTSQIANKITARTAKTNKDRRWEIDTRTGKEVCPHPHLHTVQPLQSALNYDYPLQPPPFHASIIYCLSQPIGSRVPLERVAFIWQFRTLKVAAMEGRVFTIWTELQIQNVVCMDTGRREEDITCMSVCHCARLIPLSSILQPSAATSFAVELTSTFNTQHLDCVYLLTGFVG